ncbi:YceI family protein [[Mycobacterium] kokjensenii]|uniref:YceI family protein n=1 Tax=[Mycobacterium] kokjensenii TaxID=3064287 RepID=A0ABN9NCE5_9MYCO|nr:YceI family protein [Mycolicibacter sp. MU0083]CAJ1504088.1 YceI family protein [Mycolicibacter sp. MU0083]
MSSVAAFLGNPDAIGTWNLDTGDSSIRFENGTMWGALKVRGSFTEFSGTGEIKDAKTVSGRIDIKAASISTGLGTRDHDLRRSNFFNTEHYPDITVVVNGGEPGSGDVARLDAHLTVKGITGPLPLKVEVSPLDDGGVRLTTEATVTRKQFAVEGNFLGMVGNKTRLKANLVFRKA